MRFDNFQTAKYLPWIMICFFFVWLVWAFGAPSFAEYFVEGDYAKAGLWGDSFGVLTSLFSALSFVAALGAIIYQGEGLKNQQKEINENKNDQYRRDFESYFFQMLELSRTLKNSIQGTAYDYGEGNHGAELIAIIVDNFCNSDEYKTKVADKSDLLEMYGEYINKKYEDKFGPYFRITYGILKRLQEDTVLTKEEKINFSKILRSQMTGSEVVLIAVNGLREEAKDLKDLLTHFRMLKYMPEGRVKVALQSTKLYPPVAFAPRIKMSNVDGQGMIP